MGIVADPKMDAAVKQAGRVFQERMRVLYKRAGWHPLPNMEEVVLLDGALQAIVASWLDDHREEPDILLAVQALAHVVATIVYQQVDIEAAERDFLAKMRLFGPEYAQDTSKGNA